MTLEQLDGEVWGPAEWQSSLVLTCYRLHRTPLQEFTPDDYRRMIAQGFCLEYLAPPALNLLVDDPLLEKDPWPGDLLCTLLTSERSFWAAHPELRRSLSSIAEAARLRLNAIESSERLAEDFHDALLQFQRVA